VLAVRQNWAERHPDTLAGLVRATQRASDFIEQADNLGEVAALLAQPERVGVDAELIRRTLEGRLRVSPDGTTRDSENYLLIGRQHASRPDPAQAAWLYAQMVRWGQATFSAEALKAAMSVFRPDLYESALRSGAQPGTAGAIGAFTGPDFDPADVAGYLQSFKVSRQAP
jgi:hypothetical protein